MQDRIILTIGRQFGSGGREIGKKLSAALGIGYYDKELMVEAAKDSGLCQEAFERADERTANSLAYMFTMGGPYLSMFTPYVDILSNDQLFKLQSDTIRKLAERESCVLVGRCADYILRDDPACVSFFIHNSWANRIERVTRQLGVSVEGAQELMAKKDKSRAAYSNYSTNTTWGMAESYHFSIDVSVLGIDETVNMLRMLVEKRQAVRPPHFG